ncbi:MAG: UbiA-like polyprenyltransferase [Bacteroidales bacterium]|jgi:4-hydroxybenzoate polyprenyltransferase|nr:UbiA-like polyprenyltransferase [Bacteroidales bacterium]
MGRILKTAGNYLSLVKFMHTVFAMPFALIGFTLAVTTTANEFSLRLLLLIILCMVFARNAAMGFNRLADRKFDSLNPRTEQREIPSGKVGVKSAGVFIAVNAILFVISAGLINKLTLFLSPVALAVILGYSLTKRFTFLCHFILGLGLSLAPIGAYISVTGSFHYLPILYSLIVLTWVSGFDIIYALQDSEFDREHKLHSIPSLTGRKKALAISGIVHFLTFILVVAAGMAGNGKILYLIGAIVFTGLLLWQHKLVKPDDLSRVTLAFQTTNGIASVVYAFFVILDLVIFT